MRRPSKNRSLAELATFVIVVLAARSARADEPSLHPAEGVECPSAAVLKASIVQHLGRDPFSDANAPHVDVHVRRDGATLFAEVVVATKGTPPRSRVITGDTCSDLVRAAALVAALAIEEEEPRREAPPAPPPPPAPPREAPPDARETNEAPPARDLRHARAAIAIGGTTSIGLLPRPASGVSADARVRVAESIWISARGLYLPPVTMPDDTFSMRLYGGGAGACWEPIGEGAAAAFGCAHVLAGGLEVSSSTVAMRDGGTETFVGAALSAGARARVVGPLMSMGSVESILPFGHPTFLTATCPASGFQQPFATLALSLGAGVTIP